MSPIVIKLVFWISLNKIFSVYRSSAGSGKTRTLAKAFLGLSLQYRVDYFKHILAVTFTNKASQEMKDRILAYLDDFAQGRPNELAEELTKELALDAQTFQQHSQEAQAAVLHHYAQFSISTIDAFFQKVIRSFTRESGLMGDYRLEVEQDNVLEDVIDNLIDELGSNKELTDWVVDFAKENLENERAWDVRVSLIDFAKEIFRDEFKDIEESVSQKTGSKNFFKTFREKLWAEKSKFLSRIEEPALEALNIMQSRGWTASDINYGQNSGLFTFFEMFAYQKNIKEFKAPGERIKNLFDVAVNWPSKSSSRRAEIVDVANNQLIPIKRQLEDLFEKHYSTALSAEVVLQNLYV